MTHLETLAQWASRLEPALVPDAQHALARLRILDTLGLIAAGSRAAAGAAIQSWAAATAVVASGNAATNIASGTMCAEATAALVHGTLAHARDFDDTFVDAVVHPGSTVIPTALAVAEVRGLTLAETTTAIVGGYEVAARLGRIAGRGFHARGFHATSVVGPVAAAAVAGRLMRLDAGQIADAMGLATSMSSGLMAFLADGGWSKWLHTGWSAHGGIVAAQLAANGFRGPRHGLEHAQGLYGAFLGEVPRGLAAISDGIGEVWLGQQAQFKLYPCAHAIHPYIEAALNARGAIGVDAGRVARIECLIAPWALPIVAEPRAAKVRPRNELEAIASLPYMVASAICDGEVGLAALQADRMSRADVGALADRIVCVGDSALGQGFDGHMVFHLATGERHAVAVGLPPIGPERVRAKFRANAALAGVPRASELEAALEQGDVGVSGLMRLAVIEREQAV